MDGKTRWNCSLISICTIFKSVGVRLGVDDQIFLVYLTFLSGPSKLMAINGVYKINSHSHSRPLFAVVLSMSMPCIRRNLFKFQHHCSKQPALSHPTDSPLSKGATEYDYTNSAMQIVHLFDVERIYDICRMKTLCFPELSG